jgi:hypothetical protein
MEMNERTLEKWDQGRAKPNAQAVLMLLVHHYPDTLERPDCIARPSEAAENTLTPVFKNLRKI